MRSGPRIRAASRTPVTSSTLRYTDLGTTEGLSYLERALPIYEELRDFRGQGIVLNNLGVHAYYEGRWTESLDFYRQSRAAKELVGDVIGAAVQMNNEAEILSDQGHLDAALPLFDDWLRACRASGYAFGVGVALSNLGRVAARGSRFADAYGLFEDALDQFAQLELGAVRKRDPRPDGRVPRDRGQPCAGRSSSVSRAGRRRPESPVGGLEALIERTIGYALCQGRRRDEATPHFEESLRLAREQKAEFEVALTLRAMASVGWDGAESLREESEAILERLGVVSVPHVPLP